MEQLPARLVAALEDLREGEDFARVVDRAAARVALFERSGITSDGARGRQP